MSEYDIAFTHSACSRHPSTGHAALEQLVGIGGMIQESNRSHDAESGRIKHKEKVGFNSEHYIVCKLVLGDYDKEVGGRLAPEGPLQDLLELL